MGRDSEFGKTRDRDRVALGVVMRYKEVKENSPKFLGSRVMCYLEVTSGIS